MTSIEGLRGEIRTLPVSLTDYKHNVLKQMMHILQVITNVCHCPRVASVTQYEFCVASNVHEDIIYESGLRAYIDVPTLPRIFTAIVSVKREETRCAT